jgi:nitrate/nitrite transport system substrate-binding protein
MARGMAQRLHFLKASTRRRHREQLMSTFNNPFDPDRGLRAGGCSCGRHVSQAEHHAAAQLQIQGSLESEQQRYEGVVASAVMRAMFPKDAARRAFLKSVGAATAVAALSQFFPLKTATEAFAEGGPLEKKDLKVGFIPITCATPYLATDATKLMTEAGLTPPTATTKRFVVMGKTFDPAKPEDYLNSFKIRKAS